MTVSFGACRPTCTSSGPRTSPRDLEFVYPARPTLEVWLGNKFARVIEKESGQTFCFVDIYNGDVRAGCGGAAMEGKRGTIYTRRFDEYGVTPFGAIKYPRGRSRKIYVPQSFT